MLDPKKVTIRFLGPVRRPQGIGLTTTVEVDADATLESVLASLGYADADRRRLRVLAAGGEGGAGGKPIGLSDRLEGVEELTIFLPLGGG